jgi:uncharacterized membrane protein YhaH (DUF805 family)
MKKLISKIFKITKIIYFIDGFKNYAVFKGRANRPKYWFFILYWAIGYFLVIAIENSMGLNTIDFSNYSFSKYIPLFQYSKKVGLLTLLYRPITILPSLSIAVRRLHDRNISGWWSLLFITPLGLLLLIPLIRKGDENDNKYGLPPSIS